ncbi:MAG: transcriptional repressor [Anaerolineae bacterium]|nr:transcriptional repressor [Anaerolineae bacterium]
MGNWGEQLQENLRAAGRRMTSQRRLVLQVLEASDGHLDADALCARVKARDPDVSLATVYRTLSVLRELGLVEKHHLGEDHGHYEAVREVPHYHFTCRRCGQVIEFDSSLVGQIEQGLCEREGVRVTGTHLHVSGYCARCKDVAAR